MLLRICDTIEADCKPEALKYEARRIFYTTSADAILRARNVGVPFFTSNPHQVYRYRLKFPAAKNTVNGSQRRYCMASVVTVRQELVLVRRNCQRQ